MYYRFMVISYYTSPIIDEWSCHTIIHHLASMNGNVRWYITHHRCMFMSYDTSHTIIPYDNASPSIDAWSCYMIHHIPSMLVHVIWYIDAWSCHMIHHLPSMHRHVIWPCIDGRWCIIWHGHASMVGDVSYDMKSPCIDKRWCIMKRPCIDGRWCIMWHDHVSMIGDVSYDMTVHRWYVMCYMTWPCIDGRCISYNMTMHRC